MIGYWETVAKWAEFGRFDAIFFADFWGATRDPVSIRHGKNFPMLAPLLLVSRLLLRTALCARYGKFLGSRTAKARPNTPII